MSKVFSGFSEILRIQMEALDFRKIMINHDFVRLDRPELEIRRGAGICTEPFGEVGPNRLGFGDEQLPPTPFILTVP